MNKHARRRVIGIQVLLIVVGAAVSAYGMTLAIHAGFGCATLAVLWQGVALTFGITLGQASFAIALVMIAIAWILDRPQIGVGTVLYQIVYSPLIDVFSDLHWYSGVVVVDALLMALGIIVFAIGTGVYSSTSLGKGSYEAFSFALSARFDWPIGRMRVVNDIAVVVLGMLLGGVFGLCTIFTILASGPIIHKTVETMSRLKGDAW